MKKRINVIDVVNQISSYITRGLEINVDTKGDVKMVSVRNPRTGEIDEYAFKVPYIGVANFDDETTDYLKKHGYKQPDAPKSTPAPVATVAKKKTAKWWSRFNFEKNIMKMTLLALQDRYPAEESFAQKTFAEKLASMMHWQPVTAKRHITQAAKMGIITRAVIGTAYHITGLNDVDALTAREQVAEREQAPAMMPLPGDRFPVGETPAPLNAIAHEGRIQFEQELEKAIDETILP